MVELNSDPSPERDLRQGSKLKQNPKDPFDFLDPKLNDLSLADSFLDFDFIRDWFDDKPNPDKIGVGDTEFGVAEPSMEVVKEESQDDTHLGDHTLPVSEPSIEESKATFSVSEPNGSGLVCGVKVEAEEDCKPEVNFSRYIEEEMEKVSLVADDTTCAKSEIIRGARERSESGSGSEQSRSESPSSSSSSSSDSDDDEEDEKEEEAPLVVDEEEEKLEKGKAKVQVKRELEATDELEEGEIASVNEEEIAGGMNDCHDEDEEEMDDSFGIEFGDVDDEDDGASRGPIRSKNELPACPPVPRVDVTLQPHHQMLPVGVVLSVVGAKVIVEGSENHQPLNEGSILWITRKRSLLGLVDEIFGPVKNPYYAVRYNSEDEVPVEIHEGTLISFVPEFASHVLNDTSLHKKGYDASGENDEEISDDAEFSDDEKEAEHKRLLKMSKRGMDDQKYRNKKKNKKKFKDREEAWKGSACSAPQAPPHMAVEQATSDQNRHNTFSVSTSPNNSTCAPSSAAGQQSFASGTGLVPPFPLMAHSAGHVRPLSGAWTNGMPGQQPQSAIFRNGFAVEGMPWLMQNQQNPYSLQLPTTLPIQQQQFDLSQLALASMLLSGGQPNSIAGLSNALALGLAGQIGMNQIPFGVGLQGQQSTSAAQEGIIFGGPHVENNSNAGEPSGNPGETEYPQKFCMGMAASRGRGRKPYHRGGGRFTGRRGR